MNKERLEKALKEKGAVSVKVNLGFTQNNPGDPEGHKLPPIYYPARIEAEGLTQEQIDQVVAEVEAEETAAADGRGKKEEDGFAEKVYAALLTFQADGRLGDLLKRSGVVNGGSGKG